MEATTQQRKSWGTKLSDELIGKWAEQLGAKCSQCPMGKQQGDPVAASGISSNGTSNGPATVSSAFIVGEFPDKASEANGTPFFGPAGSILNDALKSYGTNRKDTHLTYAVKCRPHRKLTGKEWREAREACAPVLEAELVQLKPRALVSMGREAQAALTGKTNVDAWRGYPLDGTGIAAGIPVFPMENPKELFKKPAYLPVWLTDLCRAMAFSDGTLKDWKWPKEILDEGEELLTFLRLVRDTKPEIALDVETGGADAFTSPLTVLGISTLDCAASFDWPPQSTETESLFREIMADKEIHKVLQNGTYDVIVLERHGIPFRGFTWDTLFAGAVVAPQLAHSLGDQASFEYYAPRWKSEFKVSGDAKGVDRFLQADRQELKTYNARDNIMTLWLKKAQERRLAESNRGYERFKLMMALGELGKRMKVRGMLVDEKARLKHQENLTVEVEAAAKKFYEEVGSEVNWQSNAQLQELFFETWKIPPTQFDKESGNPKLDAAALADILANHPKTQASRAAAALHRLRERSKLKRTYVDELPVAKWDGAVHSWWKMFTVTGRWSSGQPNMQNVPKPIYEKQEDGTKTVKRPGMRDMFVARPGMWLVEADYSQLELRILALLSGDTPLLEAYAKGEDVHQLNACALFDVPKADKNQRDFAKRFVYGLNYGGGDKTVHKSLVVNYPNLTIEQVAEMRARWENAHPQIADWQKDQVMMGRIRGYVEGPLSGRRYYFYLGRVEPTICYNYPMQSTAADIVNQATLAVDAQLDVARGEHILLQVHDALVCEGPDKDRLAKLLKKHMTITVEINGKKATFPVDIQVGKDWGHMEEYHEGK